MDLSKTSFTSLYKYEHVAYRGTLNWTLTAPFGVSGTMTFTHNLGYVPFIILHIEYPDGTIHPASQNSIANYAIFDYNLTSSSLSLTVTENGYTTGVVSGKVYYKIYAEPQS